MAFTRSTKSVEENKNCVQSSAMLQYEAINVCVCVCGGLRAHCLQLTLLQCDRSAPMKSKVTRQHCSTIQAKLLSALNHYL